MKLCVIGAGPSSAYFLKELIARVPAVTVDVFEKESRTLGHLRCGVAPDQVALKDQIEQLDQVLNQRGIRCLKNESVTDISRIREMKKNYNAVVIASGAGSPRRLNIPGDRHSVPAEELMARLNSCPIWKSGGADSEKMGGKVTRGKSAVEENKKENGENVTVAVSGKENAGAKWSDKIGGKVAVIGNGNVALDVARMLLHHRSLKMHRTVNRTLLGSTDVKEVVVIGRKSPADARFSNAVLAEIFKHPVSLTTSDRLQAYLNGKMGEKSTSRSLRRRFGLLSSQGKNGLLEKKGEIKPALEFAFWETPISIAPAQPQSSIPGLLLTTRTDTGEVKKRNVDHIITAIGHEPSHLKKLLEKQKVPGVHLLGWARTNGQGTLSDAYAEARDLAAEISSARTRARKPGHKKRSS